MNIKYTLYVLTIVNVFAIGSLGGMKRAAPEELPLMRYDPAGENGKNILNTIPQDIYNEIATAIVIQPIKIDLAERTYENFYAKTKWILDLTSLQCLGCTSKKNRRHIKKFLLCLPSKFDDVSFYKNSVEYPNTIQHEQRINIIEATLLKLESLLGNAPGKHVQVAKQLIDTQDTYWDTLQKAYSEKDAIKREELEKQLATLVKSEYFITGFTGSASEVAITTACGRFKANKLQWYLDQPGTQGISSPHALQHIIATQDENSKIAFLHLLTTNDDSVNCIINETGCTPLINAAHEGQELMVPLLLQRKAQVNRLNDQGESAIDISLKNVQGHSIGMVVYIVKLLLNHPSNTEWQNLTLGQWNGKLENLLKRHYKNKDGDLSETGDLLYEFLQK